MFSDVVGFPKIESAEVKIGGHESAFGVAGSLGCVSL